MKYVPTLILIFLSTPLWGVNCCEVKIDAINHRALSLKERCDRLKDFVECLNTYCRGDGVRDVATCSCKPTPITASSTSISQSGSYCLQNDVVDIVVTVPHVVIDLNGHAAMSVTLAGSSIIKNGQIYTLAVGSNDLVYNAIVSSLLGSGVGSSAFLQGVSSIQSIREVEHVVLSQSYGSNALDLSIGSGVRVCSLYNSLLKGLKIKKEAVDFEKIDLYGTSIKNNLVFENDSDNPDYEYALREMNIYQSIIGGEIQLWGLAHKIEHFVIEESQVGHVSMYIDPVEGSVPQKTNALFVRSVFAGGVIEGSLFEGSTESLSVQNFDGLTIQKNELTGPISLMTDNNVHLDNISVNCPNGGSAIDIGDGKNILCTDCCVTATWSGRWGYNTSAGPGQGAKNLNLIHCYALGCYNGFDTILTQSCLLKDCVCDGAADTSFRGSNVTNRAVGNVAINVDSIPSTDFNPSSGDPFDPLAVVGSSINSDDPMYSRWRNVVFAISTPVPPLP